MNSLTDLTPRQLRAAANLKERIESLERELARLVGGGAVETSRVAAPAKRRLSARGIANIRAGVRRRWAGARSGKGASASAGKAKRKMSAAGRAALAAAARARWAKAKAAGKSRL